MWYSFMNSETALTQVSPGEKRLDVAARAIRMAAQIVAREVPESTLDVARLGYFDF